MIEMIEIYPARPAFWRVRSVAPRMGCVRLNPDTILHPARDVIKQPLISKNVDKRLLFLFVGIIKNNVISLRRIKNE